MSEYPNFELIRNRFRDVIFEETKKKDNGSYFPKYELESFCQSFPNTAGLFSRPGAMSGQAVTTYYVTVISEIQLGIYGIFQGNDLVYIVKDPEKEIFSRDIKTIVSKLWEKQKSSPEKKKKGRESMRIKVKKLRENAVVPKKGTVQAAGYDLYACIDENVGIWPHETKFIGTGISVAIPEGYFGAIFARSGLACKNGLRPANCVGVIDADYRGEVKVALHNDNDSFVEKRVIQPGDRIAQLVILPCPKVELCEVEELDETERAGGGFGSTGN